MKGRTVFISLLAAVFVTVLVFGAGIFRSAAADGLTDYAEIPEGGTVLYTRTESGYLPKTSLPATYFVAVTGGETAEGYLPAGYLDLDGYVLKDSVRVVDFEPRYKYATAAVLTLINDGNTVNLRARPDHTQANVLAKIPEDAELHYYGSVSGTAQVGAIGSLWYYVRYQTGGETRYGYVYSLYAVPQAIADNVVEAVVPVGGDVDDGGIEPNDPFRPGGAATIIIIVCMSVPIVLMMFVLYRRNNKKQ